MPPDHEPAAHYDRVTNVWRLLLGDELHYGVFESGDETLSVATGALTGRMLAGAKLEPGLDLLDVGCGNGSQACRLGGEDQVRVVGITTSQVGVDLSRERAAAAGLGDAVSFELRDGTANEFPDATFDRVWVLESSHLMRACDRLVAECARVLRPGGRLVLCDIIRKREIPFLELRQRREEFGILRAAFGDAHMRPLELYSHLLTRAGLTVDDEEDLSEQTLPTFDRWRANAITHEPEVTRVLGAEGYGHFVQSCNILEALWRDATFGYGIVAAQRPG
jgi:27-O-demethylrifamycin SV methyltransferase